jgi:hypothetical protein
MRAGGGKSAGAVPVVSPMRNGATRSAPSLRLTAWSRCTYCREMEAGGLMESIALYLIEVIEDGVRSPSEPHRNAASDFCCSAEFKRYRRVTRIDYDRFHAQLNQRSAE